MISPTDPQGKSVLHKKPRKDEHDVEVPSSEVAPTGTSATGSADALAVEGYQNSLGNSVVAAALAGDGGGLGDAVSCCLDDAMAGNAMGPMSNSVQAEMLQSTPPLQEEEKSTSAPTPDSGGEEEDVPEEEAGPEPGVDGEVAAEGEESEPEEPPAVEEVPLVAPVANDGGEPSSGGFSPMTEPAPAAVNFSGPTLPPPNMSIDVSTGEDAYYAEIAGVSLSDDMCAVSDEASRLISSAQANVDELASSGEEAIVTSSARIQGTIANVQSTTGSLSSGLSSTASTAQGEVQSVAAANVAAVDASALSVADRVATITETQRAQIESRSTTLETEVQARATLYSTEIDNFITTEIAALDARLSGIILIIEKESKTEKAAAEELGRSYGGGTGGAIKEAERIAGELAKAKTKETYAKGMQRVKTSILAELRSQIGNPSELLSGNLTAPTLADIFPAAEVYDANLEKKKVEGEEKSKEAATAYGDLTTQAADDQVTSIDQAETSAQSTLDDVSNTLGTDLQCIDDQIASESEEVSAQTADDQAALLLALANAMNSQGGAPAADAWAGYSAQYELELATEAAVVTAGVQDGAQLKSDEAHDSAAAVLTETEGAVSNVTTGIQEQATDTTTAMQEGATQTFADLEHVAADSQATGDALFNEAMVSSDQALTLLDTDANAFYENRVKQTVNAYSQSADKTFADFTVKMEGAIEKASTGAAAKEGADRKARRKKCFDAMDGCGTTEDKLMSGVSGVSKVQGYALQAEWGRQHSESLRTWIIDDTSGSLMRSLLAWIVGDEQTAVTEAMDYAANAFWGPDTDVAEAALRGLSDEGREGLKGDPAFEEARDRLLERTERTASPHGTMWGWDVHDLNAITALSDMDKSKDEAELMADVIRLEDAMDRLGTDEKGVYDVLGKRDREGNEKLAIAYAQYTYEQNLALRGGGVAWEDLDEETRKQYEGSALGDALDSDFSGWEQDKAMALEVGNKGAARAADLEGASSWSNDYKAAYDAMKNPAMYSDDDWLAGVTATEEQGEFLHTMDQYASGTDRDDIRDGLGNWDTQEQRQNNVDDWDENQASTSDWITEEFDGSGSDGVINDVLHDQLETGEADDSQLMELGVDTLGTREVFVKEALDNIAAEKDVNVRLARLAALGNYCGTFFTSEIAKIDPQYKQQESDRCHRVADQGIAKLPPYVDEIEGHGGLRGQIYNVMLVLAWESSGGELFDFQLIISKATMRDNNAIDYWTYAEQQFLSMLDGDDAQDPSDRIMQFVNESDGDIAARIDDEWARVNSGALDEDEGDDGHYLDTKDVLIAHYLKAKKAFEAGAGVWYDSDGWLLTDANGQVTDAAKAGWEKFKGICDRVELAKTDLNDHNQRLSNAITAVVAVIAGVVIAIVSFGTATAATAVLISIAVTLSTGIITIATKMIIHGDRYGSEELLMDIGKVLADIAITALTAGVGGFKGIAKILDEAVENASIGMKLLAEAAKSLPGELMGVLTNETYWDTGNWEQMGTDLVLGLFKSIAAGGLGEGSSALQKAGDIDKRVGRIMDSLLGSLTDILGDPRKWEDPNIGWNLLQSLGKAALTSAVGTRILDHQLQAFNAPGYVMTQADWDHVNNTKVKDWFVENLDPRHTAGGAP